MSDDANKLSARARARTYKWSRDLYYRLSAASKIGFALDVVNIASVAYTLFFSAFLIPLSEAKDWRIRWRWIILQALGIVYTTLIYPKVQALPTRKKWIQEEVTRTQALTLALNSLAAGLSQGDFGSEQLTSAEHRILVAIASKIEAVFQDAQGMYFAVCLLTKDRNDADFLVVLNRSNQNRDSGVKYHKDKVLASKAIESGRRQYNPDFKPADGEPAKPYKSVLAFPVLFTDNAKASRALGAVSIDSARAHHFDGFEEQVEIDIAPYLGLLAVVLVCRQECDKWPEFMK